MSMVETKKKEFSYSKFEAYHKADPVYCALNGKTQNPDDGDDSTQSVGDVFGLTNLVIPGSSPLGFVPRTQLTNTRTVGEPGR